MASCAPVLAVWSLTAASLVASLVGCGSSPVHPTPGAGSSSPQPAACPATYAEATQGGSCGAPDTACGYDEGRCWCGGRAYCGGIEPPPEVLEELARPVWQCEAVRTDGCPQAQPQGACSNEGQACSYGDCCFEVVTCTGGTWAVTGGGCPP